MSFQSAPYWDIFQLSQWVRKGRYLMTCEKNHQTFLELLVTKVRTVAMDVCGGTTTAGPLDGDQAKMGINNERHWNETCTQNMQYI
jgi:hypothetical protein